MSVLNWGGGCNYRVLFSFVGNVGLRGLRIFGAKAFNVTKVIIPFLLLAFEGKFRAFAFRV